MGPQLDQGPRRGGRRSRAESSRVGNGTGQDDRDEEGKDAREMGMDRATDKTKVPIDTKQTQMRVAVQMVRMQPPLEYDEYLGMLRGRKACSQSQSVRPVRPSVDQSVSQPACAQESVSQSVSQLVGGRCDRTDFTCHPFPCRTVRTYSTAGCGHGTVDSGYAVACMSNGCHLRNPLNGSDRGQDSPDGAGAA